MKKVSFFVIIGALLLLFAIACNKQTASVSCTGNDKQFTVNYSGLNSTKSHVIRLEKGATIKVAVKSKSGRVDILVEDSNGEKAYEGHNASSGKFSFDISESGTYTFSVTGNKAKGSVSFEVID